MGSRIVFIRLALALTGVVLGGCSSTGIRLTAPQEAVAKQLAAIDPTTDPLPASTEIIDIHTHTFNARYLPLRGILLGKRDAFFPVTSVISDCCASNIAQVLIELTELAPFQGQAGTIANTNIIREIRESAHPGIICKIFLRLIEKAIDDGIWTPESPGDKVQNLRSKMRRLDALVNRMSVTEKLAIKSAMKMMGMETYAREPKADAQMLNDYEAAVRFLWILTQNDALLPGLYQQMHAGSLSRGPIRMISHMMDLGPVYNQPPEDLTLLDFGRSQVPRIELSRNKTNAPLDYFVAYNPYRSYEPGASNSTALDLVKDAVQRHGAIGVKIYPPSGYRPVDNDIKSRPLIRSTQHPGLQWDRRYGGLGTNADARNRQLDRELETLLLWCIENDVPVLAHSGYGEFQARNGYGVHNSNPLYWKKFLEKHSTNGLCKLRLCLGHAGGEDFWFGGGEYDDWGQTVLELCTTYPNVYCEVTTSSALLIPEVRAQFASRLSTLFAESARCPHPFATKLLYGTDWPLPDQGEPADLLRAIQKIFLLPGLHEYYGGYFSGNARQFLQMP